MSDEEKEKGSWGGSRPGNPNGRRGGARPGAGGLIRRGAPFEVEVARSLKVLILARGWEYTPDTVRALLTELVGAAWEEYEAPLRKAAEEWNEGVL